MDAELERRTEETVYRISAELIAIQHAVSEIAGGKKIDAHPRTLVDTVCRVRAVLKSIKGAYGVFVGGLAVQLLGYERYESRVEVVVDHEHFAGVSEQLQSITCLKLFEEGTLIERSHSTYPHPQELGENGGFAALASVVRLKLEVDRMRDQADVVEVLKRHFASASAVTAQLPVHLREKYTALVKHAARELRACQIINVRRLRSHF